MEHRENSMYDKYGNISGAFGIVSESFCNVLGVFETFWVRLVRLGSFGECLGAFGNNVNLRVWESEI